MELLVWCAGQRVGAVGKEVWESSELVWRVSWLGLGSGPVVGGNVWEGREVVSPGSEVRLGIVVVGRNVWGSREVVWLCLWARPGVGAVSEGRDAVWLAGSGVFSGLRREIVTIGLVLMHFVFSCLEVSMWASCLRGGMCSNGSI